MTADLQERVRHEDALHGERTLAYLTGNAFLVIAFATVLFAHPGNLPAEPGTALAIAIIGSLLGFLFIAVGRRSVIAIRFWRECEKAGIASGSDDDLRTFYQDGCVVLRNGALIERATNGLTAVGPRGTIYGAVPWRWRRTRSTNDVLGTLLPSAFTAFWVIIAFGNLWNRSFSIQGLTLPEVVPVGAFALIVILLSAVYYVTWPETPFHDKSPKILAVMGRGIQKVGDGWVPSPDFEMYERIVLPGRVEFRHPGKPGEAIDQTSDRCRLGGGELNVLAAAEIVDSYGLCVLGFAHPAPYLGKDGPSESHWMSIALKARAPDATVREWDGEGDISRISNTEMEVNNILEFATQQSVERVVFLSLESHLPRVMALARRACKSEIKTYRLSSESVIHELRPDLRARLRKFESSLGHERTLTSERAGLKAIEQGTYR